MTLTIGSLCSGYGGLDLAVESFFGARTAWFSEFDPAPSKVLAHHWPDVPNLGDMTVIDWASVEPVDIIAGGTPCQDLSGAGKRAGMTEGTRSNLWVQMREAIAVIKPSYVIWENVRGAYSAYAVSEVESETGLLGGYGPDRPALRALGRVLGDLSDLGYDTQWVGVRAADVGAPHGRFRVFVLAHPSSVGRETGREQLVVATETCGGRVREPAGDNWLPPAENTDLSVGNQRGQSTPGQTPRGRSRANIGGRSGTPPTDTCRDESERWGGSDPVGGTPSTSQGNGEERQRVRDTISDSGTTLTDTCCVGGCESNCTARISAEGVDRASVVDEHSPRPGGTEWGVYEPAIRRWEQVLGRSAPAPTEATGKGGAHRLSPVFVEWMMGAEPGWVTDPEIGLTRNQQLKALGNGVVTQQAEYALSLLFARVGVAA